MSLISKQIREHRQRTIAIVVAGLVAAGLGLYWFSPQSALINRSVNEPLPSTQAGAGGGSTTGVVLAEGSFAGIEHETSGKASLIDLGGGRVFLRLEGFKTLNGPDLRVRLSTAPAGGDPASFDASSINLGGLKGNIGDQNYELPAGADPSRFASAVIWCRRFSTAFGAAPLTQIPAPGR